MNEGITSSSLLVTANTMMSTGFSSLWINIYTQIQTLTQRNLRIGSSELKACRFQISKGVNCIIVLLFLRTVSGWLYGHLPPITKTIQVRRTRYAGHCLRSRDELISNVLLWTPSHGREKAGRPARTYIEQLCEDTGCSQEDLPEAMNDREKWRERVRDIRAGGTTKWWWWWWDKN